MKSENLAPLVIEAQKGNKKALNDLIESCYNDIYYFALKTVKKDDIAADVTQDACLKIIQSLGKLQDPAAFKSWALHITYNFCAMHFRKTKDVLVDENEDGETVFDTLADDSEDAQPDKAYENAEFKQMMRDMIESLPAEQASALMLYYYEKASVKEIAEIHGVSEGTVKSRLNYGRKAVKEKVEDYEKRTGIRLHSITPLPLLLAWFFAQSAEKAPATVAAAISSSVTGAAGAAAATAAGVSAAAGASATAATTATAATAAKSGISALSTKIILSVLGASVAVGAVVGGVHIAQNGNDTHTTTATTAIYETAPNPETTIAPETTAPAPHVHAYSEWTASTAPTCSAGGEEKRTCECGEFETRNVDAAGHSYENAICTVCGELKPSEGLEFTLSSNGESYELSGIGTCQDTTLVIPSTYDGKPVTSIGDFALQNCKTLVNVIIPDGVVSIGGFAFSDCYSLSRVDMPKSIRSIGTYAFFYCSSLRAINFGGTATEWNAVTKESGWSYFANNITIYVQRDPAEDTSESTTAI